MRAKMYKAERQDQKEENDETRAQLDEDFKDILPFLDTRKTGVGMSLLEPQAEVEVTEEDKLMKLINKKKTENR